MSPVSPKNQRPRVAQQAANCEMVVLGVPGGLFFWMDQWIEWCDFQPGPLAVIIGGI